MAFVLLINMKLTELFLHLKYIKHFPQCLRQERAYVFTGLVTLECPSKTVRVDQWEVNFGCRSWYWKKRTIFRWISQRVFSGRRSKNPVPTSPKKLRINHMDQPVELCEENTFIPLFREVANSQNRLENKHTSVPFNG